VTPDVIQGSPALFVPVLAVLAAMIFWIFRVRFSCGSARHSPAAHRLHLTTSLEIHFDLQG
jgi:hypothetical protein